MQLIANDTMHFLLEESLKNRNDDPLQSINLFSGARKIGKRNRLRLGERRPTTPRDESESGGGTRPAGPGAVA